MGQEIEGYKIIMLFIQTKNRYSHSYPTLEKEIISFRHSYSNKGDSLQQHYLSGSSSLANSNYLPNQKSSLNTSVELEANGQPQPQPQSPFIKRILVVDDDPDLTLTFKAGLDGHYYSDKKKFEV